MVRVRVSENHRVEPVDFFAQALKPKFRRGIDENFDRGSLDKDRGAGAMVFRIGEKVLPPERLLSREIEPNCTTGGAK